LVDINIIDAETLGAILSSSEKPSGVIT